MQRLAERQIMHSRRYICGDGCGGVVRAAGSGVGGEGCTP